VVESGQNRQIKMPGLTL